MDQSAAKHKVLDLLTPSSSLRTSPPSSNTALSPTRADDGRQAAGPQAESRNLPRQPAMNPYPYYPGQPGNGASSSQQNPQHPAQHPAYFHPQLNLPPQYGSAAYSAYPPFHQQHSQPPFQQQQQQQQQQQPQASRAPPPPSPATQTQKRKRKSTDSGPKLPRARSNDDEPSETDSPRAGQPGSSSAALIAAADLKKRTKTQRACDKCRSKKIRCDIIADADPPICQHCKQYGFECTFFLPITETRFKKKKLEEEAAAAAAAAAAEKERKTTDPSDGRPTPQASSTPIDTSQGQVKIYGPTSAPYLLHSTAGIPLRAFESYDSRYHQTWEVSKAGDGFIKVFEPSATDGKLPYLTTKPSEYKVERQMLEELVNSYFANISPMFPVVTQAEFLANPNPPPILLYAMCTVAAAQRHVPSTVFDALRMAVNHIIKTEDVLSTANMHNLQALLILSMCGDCHSSHVQTAMSAAWLRIGTAFRMAQDLGLHRAEAVEANLELRRRVWASCVISDRWYAATYGHPQVIDVADCDSCLPTPEDSSINYLNALTRLSMILGRILKAIYSPTGLLTAKDEDLEELLSQLDTWKANLPDELVFRGVDSTDTAGLLHLYYACVCMMFWRVFMRITYSCPTHLKFSLGITRWSQLVIISREAIDWLDAHETFYDSWLLVAYSVTSCALVQYHTWARRKDPEAAASLRKLRDCVRRWEASIAPGHMSTRRKTAEIISLIYEATQGFDPDKADAPGLNPTAGVKGRVPAAFRGLVFKKDASRPGGGVYIATDKIPSDMSLLPEGTIVWGGGNSPKDVSILMTEPSPTEFVDTNGLPTPGSSNPTLPTTTNLNPAAARDAVGQVQVLNMLDGPAGAFEQHAAADHGLLDGIPGTMFDFNQWETFFSRFALDPQFGAVATTLGPKSEEPQGGSSQSQSRSQQMSPPGSSTRFP